MISIIKNISSSISQKSFVILYFNTFWPNYNVYLRYYGQPLSLFKTMVHSLENNVDI